MADAREKMMNDTVRWIFAIVFLAGALVGGRYVPDEFLAFKYIGMSFFFLITFAIIYKTDKVQLYKKNLIAARMELLKVTWPTKDETVKTTIMVSVVVCIFAFIMWLLDAGLTKIVTMLIQI